MHDTGVTDRFAMMWQKSRADAGKSQEFVAKALGVSKTTIQNWEQGLSCPNQRQGFEWFKVLGLPPMPYYLSLLYPEFDSDLSVMSDEQVDAALLALMTDLPTDVKRKILYIALGNHGSSPLAVLELMVAHLQLPLQARVSSAVALRTNYEVAEACHALVGTNEITPNIEVIEKAYAAAKKAVKERKTSYSIQ